jgi:spermidine synthase/MFS family permease
MSRRLLQLIVFTSGMSVMAVEMTGLRLLAPYFGTSLLVTTALIGTLMGFLSLGYWLGGRIADRHPTLRALSKATMVAGVLVLVIPFVSQPILRIASAALRPLLEGKDLADPAVAFTSLIGGLLGTLALLSLPVTIMGMVSPWAIRLAVVDVEQAGKIAGRLYALSTFGSIVGSFLPALFLVPVFGVRNTFIVVGTTFVAVSAIGLLGGGKKLLPPAASAMLLLVPPSTIRPMDGLIYETESLYHFIQVVEEPFGKCPNALHLYLNEGVGVHSVKCPDDNIETLGEWTYMAAGALWLDEPAEMREALIVGLAGGTSARQLLDAFPDTHIDGVEIDSAVVEIGKRYFDNDDPRIDPIVMDGRNFLQVTDRKYDLVLMDAYRQPYIPFHLVTREFFELVRDHMNDDAVLAVNVASVRGVSRELAQMIYKTMKEVFPTVVLVDATRSNDIIIATSVVKSFWTGADHAEAVGSAVALQRIKRGLRKKIIGPVPGWESARVLTDDQAPVEMAWDMMAIEYAQ